MKNEAASRQSSLLSYLSHLPKKILSLKEMENIPEFVLHELCNESCFNLTKAAFFVDNPDFNFLKGIAGFSAQESFNSNIWQDPHAFTEHMQRASFNQKVRNSAFTSLKRGDLREDSLKHILREFDFKNPATYSWDMKHDNHGFLIYEYNSASLDGIEDYLTNSLYLLGFCPIF